MGKVIDAEIKGLKQTLFKMAELSAQAGERVKKQIKESAESIKEGAEERVPVLTGELKEEIIAEISEDGFGAKIGVSKKVAWRGKFVEFGTVKMTAKPFLFPSFEEERPKYLKGIRRAVKGE